MTGIATQPSIVDSDELLRHRLRLVREDAVEDDVMVALGMVAAGLHAPAHAPDPPATATWADRVLAGARSDDRARLYDLWYRMKVHYDGPVPVDRWYLATLAFGQAGGDLGEALATFTAAWEDLVVAGAAAREVYGRRFGVVASPPAQARHPFDVEALRDAVARRAPLCTTDDDTAGPTAWPGTPAPGGTADARADWLALRDEERLVLLCELMERIEALEQVRLHTDGELLDNRGVTRLLDRCSRTHPDEWSLAALSVATLVRMWKDSGTCLQERNQTIAAVPFLYEFAGRRIREYEDLLGCAHEGLPRRPAALARRWGALRVDVERRYFRCLQFDGANWERREFVVGRDKCAALLGIPADLAAHMHERFGATSGADGQAFWEQTLDAALESGGTPTDVAREFAHWIAGSDTFPVDFAILTAPKGVKLDKPWELEFDEVFCYVGLHPRFSPSSAHVPFDVVGIMNAIGQRMRYNVVKKAQNYTLLRRFKAQSFNLPDIAVAEDANHAGHAASGIRLSCRIPTHIHHGGRTWKGLADVRLNRVDYRQDNEFTPSDVPLANRYAVWLGWLADATYERGLLFDERYCRKLTQEPVR